MYFFDMVDLDIVIDLYSQSNPVDYESVSIELTLKMCLVVRMVQNSRQETMKPKYYENALNYRDWNIRRINFYTFDMKTLPSCEYSMSLKSSKKIDQIVPSDQIFLSSLIRYFGSQWQNAFTVYNAHRIRSYLFMIFTPQYFVTHID